MDGASDIGAARYDEDFIAWAKAQAALIRARDFAAVDWDNVVEEMESLGKSERNQLDNRIARIIEHLLKLDHGQLREPEAGWRDTVDEQRDALDKLLSENPSLRREVTSVITKEYDRARRRALRFFALYEPEAAVDYAGLLPESCSYSVDDVLGE